MGLQNLLQTVASFKRREQNFSKAVEGVFLKRNFSFLHRPLRTYYRNSTAMSVKFPIKVVFFSHFVKCFRELFTVQTECKQC